MMDNEHILEEMDRIADLKVNDLAADLKEMKQHMLEQFHHTDTRLADLKEMKHHVLEQFHHTDTRLAELNQTTEQIKDLVHLLLSRNNVKD